MAVKDSKRGAHLSNQEGSGGQRNFNSRKRGLNMRVNNISGNVMDISPHTSSVENQEMEDQRERRKKGEET